MRVPFGLLACYIAACGTSTPPADGGVDASVNDAGDGSSSSSVHWTCNNVPVADCTECGTRTNPPETHPCVNCSDAGYLGHCTLPGVSCGIISGDWCACTSSDPSACPESYQVCWTSRCVSCGDIGSDGLPCQGGGVCQSDAGQCH